MRSTAGAARELGFWGPVLEATIAIVCCRTFGLGFAGCPPDEPEGADDWDLQDDEQEKDWPESLHGAQCRDKAHCRKAST